VYVLRSYLDDSGSIDDPSNRFLTVAGYVADEYGWECFEAAWQKALDEAGIPYMHMREFGDPTSPVFGKLRSDKIRHLNFMLDAVSAIGDHLHTCVSATLSIADFEAFVDRHSLDLDPLSVVTYGCIKMMRRYYSQEPIEIILDRFDRSTLRAAKALDYASTDTSADLMVHKITPIPLQDEESFKTVLPLQAADFIAWEVRKSFEDRKGFTYTTKDKGLGRQHMSESYLQWVSEQQKLLGSPPRERRSYMALRKAIGAGPICVLFDEFNLEQMLRCHSNGWVPASQGS